MKKHFFLVLQCFILLCAVCSNCGAQNSASFLPGKSIANPQEKVYIHYDKSRYVLGDTVWFKAYLFNGTQRSKLSKTFYFELLNDKGKVLTRITAPIFESTASGNLVLPADTSNNGFYCRAYTANMLQDSALMYQQALSIINSHKQISASKTDIKISFMPEGGDWVNNLPTLMAFKVTDNEGLPVAASGVVKENNKTLMEFSTLHDGMGAFTIIPQNGQDYSVTWKDNFGTEHNTNLPKPRAQGIGLHVNDMAGGKKFFVFRSAQVAVDDQKLVLTASINNVIVYHAQIDFSMEQGANGSIPTTGLPSGLLYITLYNKNLKPVAERVTFLNNHDYAFKIDTNIIALSKLKRGSNKIRLSTTDTLRKNISVSVTDADVDMAPIYRDNIISHLLLTGDLRGKIFNPYYYFASHDDTTARNLDLVMLTNGWRKYTWDKLAQISKESNYLTLAGQVYNAKPTYLQNDPMVNIILQTPDSSSVLIPAILDKGGQFSKDGYIFYGDAKLYFKFADKNLQSGKLNVQVNNGLLDTLRNIPVFKMYIPTNEEPELPLLLKNEIIARKTNLLKEVLIKGVKETETLDKAYTTGLFKKGISKNFNVGADPNAMNNLSLFQYLQNKVPGLLISNAVSGYPSLSWRNEKVYIYLNNFPVAAGDIRNIAMSEFDYVKVYDPANGGMFGVFGGVISVYTKMGKRLNSSTDNRLTANLSGYTPIKEFYSPDYATLVTASTKADTRTTLYWNPNIVFDKHNMHFELKFYNNDITSRFKIVLEGINNDGKLVHMEKVL